MMHVSNNQSSTLVARTPVKGQALPAKPASARPAADVATESATRSAGHADASEALSSSALKGAMPWAASRAGGDTVRFRGKDNEAAASASADGTAEPEKTAAVDHADSATSADDVAEASEKILKEPLSKRLLINGPKEALRGIFNKNAFIDDAIMCGIFSVVLILIPGHQIFSVPLVFATGAALRGTFGFFAGFRGHKADTRSGMLTLWNFFRGKNKAE